MLHPYNILNEEAIDAIGERIREDPDAEIPAGILMRILRIILENNVFEFNDDL